jgi:hypothetical protein
MSRSGTLLRTSLLLAFAFASTACLKFTPEVTSLSSEQVLRPPWKPNGYFSSLSYRQSASSTGYKLKGSLDRISSPKSSSVTHGYGQKISPLLQSETSGGSL